MHNVRVMGMWPTLAKLLNACQRSVTFTKLGLNEARQIKSIHPMELTQQMKLPVRGIPKHLKNAAL
jgi:hypothetical protein